MSNKHDLKNNIKILKNIDYISNMLYLNGQLGLYSNKQKLNLLSEKLQLLKDFPIKKGKKNKEIIKILVLLEDDCAIKNLPYKGEYDIIVGLSGKKLEKYLCPLEKAHIFLEKYENLQFIVAKNDNTHEIIDQRVYLKEEKPNCIIESCPKELNEAKKKLLIDLAITKAKIIENTRIIGAMDGAMKKIKKIMKKNKNLYKNLMIKENTNNLIINSVNN